MMPACSGFCGKVFPVPVIVRRPEKRESLRLIRPDNSVWWFSPIQGLDRWCRPAYARHSMPFIIRADLPHQMTNAINILISSGDLLACNSIDIRYILSIWFIVSGSHQNSFRTWPIRLHRWSDGKWPDLSNRKSQCALPRLSRIARQASAQSL